MSSRKFAVDRGSTQNFPEKNVDKFSSNEKKLPRSSGGFFIKHSNKNKKSISLDATVNNKTKPIASQKESFRRTDKQPCLAQDGDESKTKTQLFDKKAWRFKRYSKKYKLDQWKDVRKTHVLRGLDKTFSDNSTIINFKKEYVNHAKTDTHNETVSEKGQSLLDDDTTTKEQKFTKSKQNSLFHQNKLIYKRNQANKEVNTKKIESLKRKATKDKAIKEYKRKKMEKFKKLSRKTKKGQPVMKDRMEVLLEEIQNSIRQ